ncbi:unnamed protein product [Prunus armeniaca]
MQMDLSSDTRQDLWQNGTHRPMQQVVNISTDSIPPTDPSELIDMRPSIIGSGPLVSLWVELIIWWEHLVLVGRCISVVAHWRNSNRWGWVAPTGGLGWGRFTRKIFGWTLAWGLATDTPLGATWFPF